MEMRIFQNIIYDVKMSYGDAFEKVLECLAKNGRSVARPLFFMEDISEARTDSRTSAAKICRDFPELEGYRRFAPPESRYAKFGGSVLTNLPDVVAEETFDGAGTYGVKFKEDGKITAELLRQLGHRIPRPYSLYGSSFFLDGIEWYPGADTVPALDRCFPTEPFEKGWITFPSTISYQGNCVLVTKDFAVKTPEIDIRIEVRDSGDRERIEEIVRQFNEFFDKPSKKYMVCCCKREAAAEFYARAARMQIFLENWSEETLKRLLDFEGRRREELAAYYRDTGEKILSRQVQERHFTERNGLSRAKVRRWDDRTWNKEYPTHYFLHITPWQVESNSCAMHTEQDGRTLYEKTLGMYFAFEGCNFYFEDFVEILDLDDEAGDISSLLQYEIQQKYLDAFEKEALPVLRENYGDSPGYFCQESGENNANRYGVSLYGFGFQKRNYPSRYWRCTDEKTREL